MQIEHVFIAYLTHYFLVVSKLEHPEPWVVMKRRKGYFWKKRLLVLTNNKHFSTLFHDSLMSLH